MFALVLQAAFSSVLGLMLADVFRSKPKDGEVGMNAQQALALAHLRNRVAGMNPQQVRAAVGGQYGAPLGHFVPDDTAEMERTLWDIADAYTREAGTQNFPGVTSVSGVKGRTMFNVGSAYDLVGNDGGGSFGADLMFGAGDSDVLEALSVSGDGSSEIIGADLIGQAQAGNPRAKAALRAIAMRNAGAVIKNDLKNRRRYPLGFVPTEVDSGDAATIPAAPQNLFRPERLVIPSDIAFDFGVQDIKVGNQSQFAQSVEVPAAVFTEVSIDTNVTFDTAEVGNQISILVRNKGTTNDLEFTAAALGTIAKA